MYGEQEINKYRKEQKEKRPVLNSTIQLVVGILYAKYFILSGCCKIYYKNATVNLKKKKNRHIQGRISSSRLVLNSDIQHDLGAILDENILSKFQYSKYGEQNKSNKYRKEQEGKASFQSYNPICCYQYLYQICKVVAVKSVT